MMQNLGMLFWVAVVGYALAGMLIAPRMKAGAALLCAVCGMLFVSFYGVIMLGWMVPVAYGLMYGGLAAFAAGAAGAALNWRNLRARLLSPGMIFFGIAAVLLVIKAQPILIQDHDSLSYWLRAARELYTFDSFYIHADATMFHRDYIPLLASLQYCVTRVFGWSDSYVVYVTSAVIAASAAAMADLLPKRRTGAAAVLVMMYAFVACGFDTLSTRADGPMLMLFTAALLSVLFREDDSPTAWTPALFACAVLVGFKIYSGLMFAAVVLLAMFAEWCGLRRRKADTGRLGLVMIASLALVLALQFGWSALYNSAEAMADVEEAAARAVYAGEQAAQGDAELSVGALLSGNPRTAQLMKSFTPEAIEKFLGLTDNTFAMYRQSWLPWAWLFVAATAVLAVLCGKEKRRMALKLFGWLLLAGVIYLIGLFASYFVQAETAPAAIGYLTTVTAPLLIACAFLTLWLTFDCSPMLRRVGLGALAAVLAGLMVIYPPARVFSWEMEQSYESYGAMAHDFYADELDGLLTPEDAGKRALLIDNSYAATEVRSQSGKTHAYAYYALPVRVAEPIYYRWGDYTEIERGLDVEYIFNRLLRERTELLILRIEDSLWWDELSVALGLDMLDWAEPVGVYDVTYEDGEFAFALREM